MYNAQIEMRSNVSVTFIDQRAADAGVDGGWSDWSSWTKCSKTCGPGTKSRSRACTKPKQSGSGKPCFGKSLETPSCEITACEASREGIYEIFDRRIDPHYLRVIDKSMI